MMQDYTWLHEYCLNRFGSSAKLEERLPTPKSADELAAVADDRYLSLISLRVFRAGLKHSLVDSRWPAFEQAFFGFDPEKAVLMGAEHLERLMHNDRLIRHFTKLRSVPHNAQMILDLAREYGSFGRFLAQWPVDETVGLWKQLARRGKQLGGMSAPLFLRMAGKDTFLLTEDVITALKAQGIVDKAPTSQRDLAAVQQAFQLWREQSGRPFCQISMMLSFTVNH